MSGQGNPKECVWGREWSTRQSVAYRTDVAGREGTGYKVRRPPSACSFHHLVKINMGLWKPNASGIAFFLMSIHSVGVYGRNFYSFTQHVTSGLLLCTSQVGESVVNKPHFLTSEESGAVVGKRGYFCCPGDMWQHLATYSVVITGEVILASSEYRPGMC